jgi:hypothetical protein
MNFPPRSGRVSGRATPSLRHARARKCKGPTLAAVHLTYAESCSNYRDQLWRRTRNFTLGRATGNGKRVSRGRRGQSLALPAGGLGLTQRLRKVSDDTDRPVTVAIRSATAPGGARPLPFVPVAF